MSMNYVLKLNNLKLKSGVVLKEIPDFESITTQKHGKLIGKSYFVKNKLTYRKIRFTTKDKSFNTIYSIDIFDVSGNPVIGLQIDGEIPKEKLISSLDKLSYVDDLKRKIPTTIKFENLLYEFDDFKQSKWSVFLSFLTNFAPALIGFVVIIYFWIKTFINWRTETVASTSLETEINNELFEGQTGDEQAFEIYNKTISYVKNVAHKKLKAVILCGPPGMSKTYIVRRTLHFEKLKPGVDYNIQKGATASIQDVYQMLWDSRDKLLVLDDFDTPLKDPNMVNFLKSITDSYAKRIISMPREKTIGSGGDSQEISDAPKKFEFKGQILIITNLKIDDIDLALRSRAPAINVEFDSKQIFEAIHKMLKYLHPKADMKVKVEVYNYIDLLMNSSKIKPRMDFRKFKTCLDARISVPEEWKTITKLVLFGK